MLTALPAELLALVCMYLQVERDYTALTLTCKPIRSRMPVWHYVLEHQMARAWPILTSPGRLLRCKPDVLDAINDTMTALRTCNKGLFASLGFVSVQFLCQLSAHGANAATVPLVVPIVRMIAARNYTELESRIMQLKMFVYIMTTACETNDYKLRGVMQRFLCVTHEESKLLREIVRSDYLQTR